MKKNLLISVSTMLITIVLFYSCQKERRSDENNLVDLSAKKELQKNECRLTALLAPTGYYHYLYNAEGLNNEWEISDYGIFKQTYDDNGRLVQSKWYIGDDLISTIDFIYNSRGKVDHETWYYGATQDIYDEVFYTYDIMGRIIRNESFIGDFYTITSYTPESNTKEFFFYLGGSLFYSGHYGYASRYKNPYLAVPGIEYGFPFLNPTLNYNKWWAESEKIVFYDENGTPFIIHDYDVNQTIWEPGFQNYPASVTYYDSENEVWDTYSFEYENCGPGGNSNTKLARPTGNKAGKAKPGMMNLLRRNPSMPVKEQFKQLREQLKK